MNPKSQSSTKIPLTTRQNLRPVCFLWAVLSTLPLIACGPAVDSATGVDAHQRWAEANPDAPDSGVWRPNPWAATTTGDPDETLLASIRRLETLGYAGSTEPIPGLTGVVTYDPERAYNGYTIVLSSHNTEARLIDMLGRSLHVWSSDPDIDWQDYEDEFTFEDGGIHFERRKFYHRAHLYTNGDLLVMIYAYGLLKLDKDSNTLWWAAGPVHHDMEVTPNGDIYTLDRKAGLFPEIHPSEPVLDELISIFSADGERKRQVSILQAMRNSDFSPVLKTSNQSGEIFHSNALRVLDGRFTERNPAFKAGNVLTSFRHQSAVCIVDMDTEKVVWYMTGPWLWQHDPRLTDSGTMTVFDNRGVALYLPGRPGHIGSRIIEIDPLTQKVLWTFTGSNDLQFYSNFVGSSIRLPNGNTFINETRRGRYIEVAPDGELVWEFINPNQTGPENQYIAELYDVLRFGPDFPFDWLDPAPPSPVGPVSASLPDNPSHRQEIAAR